MTPFEWRQDYTADCPLCGHEATFTTVGVLSKTETAEAEFGLIDAWVLGPKRVARVEVACPGCG